MSIISNLMLLPENINKSKGKRSLGEYWDALDSDGQNKVRDY